MNFDRLRPPGWLRWVGVVAVAGVIFYSSVIEPPSSGVPHTGPLGLFGFDKWLHVLAYGGLAGALATALAPGRGVGRAVVLAAALALAYGVGIEFAQAVVPTRAFSVGDILANVVGVTVGAVCWRTAFAVTQRLEAAQTAETNAGR
ncbi:VanZ family protein [Halorussus amylolyticus]|uniref:VanZ family protein n=1 Tax=Halorussus amylolyticus TaxID=1126242 RepID=UPI00104C6243|nr:VanZ family protein [Halorussus amylolyticus]